MTKKAQAAMEFLMTYGWAILVVIAAIAALAYFGVLDPSNFLPEKCDFPTGLSCVDKPALDADLNTVKMSLKNSNGFPINITSVTSANSASAGCAGSNCTSDRSRVENGVAFIISCNCGDVTPGKFTETISVTYLNTESNLTHKAVGTVRGKA